MSDRSEEEIQEFIEQATKDSLMCGEAVKNNYQYVELLFFTEVDLPVLEERVGDPGLSKNTSVPAEETAPAMTLAEAVASDLRSAGEKARDAWRNPVQTLEFFGVQADDKVIEVWPGGGWYTSIIAPWLASGGGTLVAAGYDPAAALKPDGSIDEERKARLESQLTEFKETYADPQFGAIEYTVFSAASGPLTADGTADVVLTFRNIHNWMSGGYTEKFFADAYTALKPGGVLGVVEHRLPSTQAQDPKATSGYVHEDYVKALATAAGFEFVEASEINANPADTADHPFGVWTLPPNNASTGRDGAAVEGFDPETYKAIGESDRMTLKFRKRSSLLNVALGNRWSIGDLPCELNGGAYDTFTVGRGIVLTAAGVENVAAGATSFEYVDLGQDRFSYRQKFFANDFVARQLGDPNALSASLDIEYTRTGSDSMTYRKTIRQLNVDSLLNGRAQYDTVQESGQTTLCDDK